MLGAHRQLNLTRTTREQAEQAEHAYKNSPQGAKPRGRPQAPDVCASLRQSLAPTPTIPPKAMHCNST
jgi:hypothetical protein